MSMPRPWTCALLTALLIILLPSTVQARQGEPPAAAKPAAINGEVPVWSGKYMRVVLEADGGQAAAPVFPSPDDYYFMGDEQLTVRVKVLPQPGGRVNGVRQDLPDSPGNCLPGQQFTGWAVAGDGYVWETTYDMGTVPRGDECGQGGMFDLWVDASGCKVDEYGDCSMEPGTSERIEKMVYIHLVRQNWVVIWRGDGEQHYRVCVFRCPLEMAGAAACISPSEPVDLTTTAGRWEPSTVTTGADGCAEAQMLVPPEAFSGPSAGAQAGAAPSASATGQISVTLGARTNNIGPSIGTSTVEKFVFGRVIDHAGKVEIYDPNGLPPAWVPVIDGKTRVTPGCKLHLLPDFDFGIYSPRVTIDFSDGSRVTSRQTFKTKVTGLGQELVIGSGVSGAQTTHNALAQWIIDARNDPQVIVDTFIQDWMVGVATGGLSPYGWVVEQVGNQIVSWMLSQALPPRQQSAASSIAFPGNNGNLSDVRVAALPDGTLVVQNSGGPVTLSSGGLFTTTVQVGTGQELAIPGPATRPADIPAPVNFLPSEIGEAPGLYFQRPITGTMTGRLASLRLWSDQRGEPGSLVVRIDDALRTSEFRDCTVSTDPPWSHAFCATLPLAEGWHNASAAIQDYLGYRGTAQLRFLVDGAPAAPVRLAALAGPSRVLLSWGSGYAAGISGYDIYRDTQKLNPTPTSDLAWLDTTPGAPGATVHYTVVAVDSAAPAPSAPAGPVTVMLPSAAGPTAPQAPISVTVTPAGDGQLRVSWAMTPTQATAFRVYQAGNSGGPFSAIRAIGSPAIRTTVLDSLPVGTPHWYRVTALGSDLSEGPPSAAVSGASTDAAPAAPTGLTAVADGKQVSVAWNPSPAADLAGYRVYRAVGSAGFVLITPQLLAVPTLTDIGSYGASYQYQVVAVDTAGHASANSRVVQVSTIPDPATMVPPRRIGFFEPIYLPLIRR
jgi:hypothetical protein